TPLPSRGGCARAVAVDRYGMGRECAVTTGISWARFSQPGRRLLSDPAKADSTADSTALRVGPLPILITAERDTGWFRPDVSQPGDSQGCRPVGWAGDRPAEGRRTESRPVPAGAGRTGRLT